MKKVSSLFERFAHIKAPQRYVKKIVIEVVHEVTGVNICVDTIMLVQKKIIYINTSSVIKNVIFENKDSIISRINHQLKQDQIKDIR